MDEERKFALKMAVKHDGGKGNTDICALANKFLVFLRDEEAETTETREATRTKSEQEIVEFCMARVGTYGIASIDHLVNLLKTSGFCLKSSIDQSRRYLMYVVGKSKSLCTVNIRDEILVLCANKDKPT